MKVVAPLLCALAFVCAAHPAHAEEDSDQDVDAFARVVVAETALRSVRASRIG